MRLLVRYLKVRFLPVAWFIGVMLLGIGRIDKNGELYVSITSSLPFSTTMFSLLFFLCLLSSSDPVTTSAKIFIQSFSLLSLFMVHISILAVSTLKGNLPPVITSTVWRSGKNKHSSIQKQNKKTANVGHLPHHPCYVPEVDPTADTRRSRSMNLRRKNSRFRVVYNGPRSNWDAIFVLKEERWSEWGWVCKHT